MITETEDQKINTAEEMVKTLVNEISLSKINHSVTGPAKSLSD
jgi:hypothetical protein